jgi:hypothetical protein
MNRVRLKHPLPLKVEFKTASFVIKPSFVVGSRHWRLNAAGVNGEWILAEESSEENFRKTLFESGMAVRSGTVPELILRRLVRDGCAEEVFAASEPSVKRPSSL